MGRMTRALQGTIKSCQDQIIHLLTTGEDTELPTGVSLPETDYSQFLTWQTGKVPANAQLMAGPLPASKDHDVPTKPRTYMGRVCTVKVCQKHDPVATRSLRFAPSGMCCRCWERAKKTTTREAP